MVVCYWFVSLERPERPWRPSERRGGQRQTSTAVISGFNWSGVRQRACHLLSRAGSSKLHSKNGVKVLESKLAVSQQFSTRFVCECRRRGLFLCGMKMMMMVLEMKRMMGCRLNVLKLLWRCTEFGTESSDRVWSPVSFWHQQMTRMWDLLFKRVAVQASKNLYWK